MFQDRLTNKEIMICIYNATLLSYKKRGNLAVHCSMDGTVSCFIILLNNISPRDSSKHQMNLLICELRNETKKKTMK